MRLKECAIVYHEKSERCGLPPNLKEPSLRDQWRLFWLKGSDVNAEKTEKTVQLSGMPEAYRREVL